MITPARTYQLTLPWPPSVNHYWRIAPQGGLYIDAAGLRFRRATSERVAELRALRRLPALPVQGRLGVVIDASAPAGRSNRFDLDNLVKATQDALVHASLIEDDSQIDDLRVLRDEPVKDGRILITITEIESIHRRAA